MKDFNLTTTERNLKVWYKFLDDEYSKFIANFEDAFLFEETTIHRLIKDIKEIQNKTQFDFESIVKNSIWELSVINSKIKKVNSENGTYCINFEINNVDVHRNLIDTYGELMFFFKLNNKEELIIEYNSYENINKFDSFEEFLNWMGYIDIFITNVKCR